MDIRPSALLVLKNVKTGELSNLKVAGVFMFVGQAPDDDCVRGLVKAEKGGWILINKHMETSVEMLDIIKTELKISAGDLKSFGIDVDLDKLYL